MALVITRRTLLILSLVVISAPGLNSSKGDSSLFYQNCVKSFVEDACLRNGAVFKIQRKNTLLNGLVQWRCLDEGKYECMWKTVNGFLERNLAVPQFHGKWPFVRWLGMTEPASVVFSLLNLAVHIWGLRKLRALDPKPPRFYSMWVTFSLICINAWICSSIFHTRDTEATEIFDYSAAYSMVISSFYCMVLRIALGNARLWLKALFSVCVALFFLQHIVLLTTTRSYSYNMQVNIVTGSTAGVGWLVWGMSQRRKRPYVKNMMVFVTLSALALGLEVLDFPPIFYVFDAHSLWHLVTAPLTVLLYRFILDDCSAIADEQKEKLP